MEIIIIQNITLSIVSIIFLYMILVNNRKTITSLIELNYSLSKLIKSNNLQEFEETQKENNLLEEQEKEQERFVDISDLSDEEFKNIEVNPENVYKWVVYNEDKQINKKENII